MSSFIALLGIALATFLWLKNPQVPASLAARFPGLHRLLLNKYYVDEIYDAAIVHPIERASHPGAVEGDGRGSSTARSTWPGIWWPA